MKRLTPAKPPKPRSTLVQDLAAVVTATKFNEAARAPRSIDTGELHLEASETLAVQLGNERILNAQLHLQNRRNEFDQLVVQLRAKYEEGGKFVMTSLDIGQGVIVRRPK